MNKNVSLSRYTNFLQNLPSLGVFALGLVITIFSVFINDRHHQEMIAEHARHDAIEYRRLLQSGTDAYIRVNRDVAGLFAMSQSLTFREFEAYLRSVDALETHPGLGYIGYIPRVAIKQLAGFEAKARKDFPAYKIRGAHADTDFAYPLQYAFPHDDRVTEFIGFDFSSDPERWKAMQKARDIGKSIATGKLDYLKNPLQKAVVFILTPIYESDKPIETIAQRRAALIGFVYSSFVVDEVISGAMGIRFKSLFDLEIYDTQVDHNRIIYDGDGLPHAVAGDGYPIAHQENVNFAGRKWVLYFFPKAEYLQKYANHVEILICLSGVLLSFALALATRKWQRYRHARRLQVEHGQRFQAVFENHPSAVFSLDPQRRIINANANALKNFGLGKEKLIGSSIEQFIVPENVERTRKLYQEVLAGNAVTFDDSIITNTGMRLEVSVILIPVTIAGEVTSVLGIAKNITERKRAEWKLQESRQMLQLVIDNIPQRVFWKNTELVFLGCNTAFCKDAGVAHPDEVIGKTDYDLPWKAEADLYRQDDREMIESRVARINYEEPQLRKDGSKDWLRTSKIPLLNHEGRTVGVLGMYEDITEHKQLEQKLKQMAHYDSLTGLPNRAYFYDQLHRAISRSNRHGSVLALMYLDIDKFKHINDTYGHGTGDAVIAEFARRVKSNVRDSDIVARLGGDEFCLIFEDLASTEAAETIATKLVEAMKPTLRISEAVLQISTSIGIAFHEPGMAANELIRRADHAMYQAKQAGRNRFAIRDDKAVF